MGFTVSRHAALDGFLAAAHAFLAAREAENNLLFGIVSQIRSAPELYGDPPPAFATVHDRAGDIAAATLRTPPWNQVLSWVDDLGAVDALAIELSDDRLPGIVGPSEAVRRFAERTSALTRRRWHRAMAERTYRLERVVPPQRPVSGRWRFAEPRDRDTLIRWLGDFHDEATPHQPRPDDPGVVVDRWIARRHRSLYLWEDGGRIVSLAGVGGETPNGIRIGPVYTPPGDRDHGYASAITAAASAHQLASGRRFCFLFTDLANPTSNRIYRAIGYEPVCDMDALAFEDPDA